MFGSSLTCLALCEIIDKKEDFTSYPGKTGGGSHRDGIYVVPREVVVVVVVVMVVVIVVLVNHSLFVNAM